MALQQTQKTKPKNGRGKWLEMLAFPPAILAPVLFIALLTREAYEVAELSIPVLASFLFLYTGLSFAYLTLRKKGQRNAAWAAAILADALLFVFASSQMSASPAFGWTGVVLVILGMILAVSQLTPTPTARFAQQNPDLLPENIGKSEVKRFISAIAFPAAFLETNEEGEERVVAANDALAAILGRVAGKLDGVLFSDLIPSNLESRAFVFADAEWVPHRTTKGKQTMFMLSPAVKVVESEAAASDDSIVDAESGLYTPYYMKYKAVSDVQSCRRYKRHLALLLFRLTFSGDEDTSGKNLVPPSDETKQTAFIAFARMVSMSIRTCDTAYRVGEHEIVLFLPDTSQQGAKVVLMRITDNMRKIAKVEVPELGAACLTEAAANFFGEEIVSLDQVMQELYLSMGRSEK